MRINARSRLTRFLEGLQGQKDYHGVKAAVDSWFKEARLAEWKNSSDVKASYAHAIIVGADCVVFNFKGNSYRLVVAMDYRRGIVFTKWLGTHKEYDAVDVRTVAYGT